MRGVDRGDSMPKPKYDAKSTVRDGYSHICPKCFVRHGNAEYGGRFVGILKCPKCTVKDIQRDGVKK